MISHVSSPLNLKELISKSFRCIQKLYKVQNWSSANAVSPEGYGFPRIPAHIKMGIS